MAVGECTVSSSRAATNALYLPPWDALRVGRPCFFPHRFDGYFVTLRVYGVPGGRRLTLPAPYVV